MKSSFPLYVSVRVACALALIVFASSPSSSYAADGVAKEQFDRLAEQLRKPFSDRAEARALSKTIEEFLTAHHASLSNREYHALRTTQDQLNDQARIGAFKESVTLEFRVSDNPRSHLKLPALTTAPTPETLEVFGRSIPEHPFEFFDTLYDAGGGLDELKVELAIATSAATYLLTHTQREAAKPNLAKIKQQLVEVTAQVDSLAQQFSTPITYQNLVELTAALRRGLDDHTSGVSPRVALIDACGDFKTVRERIGIVATKKPGAWTDVISKFPTKHQRYCQLLWDIGVVETLLHRLYSEERFPALRKR